MKGNLIVTPKKIRTSAFLMTRNFNSDKNSSQFSFTFPSQILWPGYSQFKREKKERYCIDSIISSLKKTQLTGTATQLSSQVGAEEKESKTYYNLLGRYQ